MWSVDAITHDPNRPICMVAVLHAWKARFGPREWPRQEEGGRELKGKVDIDITGIPDH